MGSETGEGESLKQIDEQHAGVFWNDGTEAMMISAQPAHGADGETVNTTLAISEGNVVTETIHYKIAGVVYPVAAGLGWEGGFQTHYSEFVEPPKVTPANAELTFMGRLNVSPPEPIDGSDTEASASGFKGVKKHFSYVECSHDGQWAEEQAGLASPSMEWVSELQWTEECGNPFTKKNGNGVVWRAAIHGKFFIKEGVKVWHEGGPNDSIGCIADTRTDLYPELEGGAERKAFVDRCVWWGTTPDGGGSEEPMGKHITPALRVHGEERSNCELENHCEGQPNPWVRVDSIPPISVYIWAVGRINAHETDCIDCD